MERGYQARIIDWFDDMLPGPQATALWRWPTVAHQGFAAISWLMYSRWWYTLWWTNKLTFCHGKIYHFSWENPLFLWPLSIAMLVIARGYSPPSTWKNLFRTLGRMACSVLARTAIFFSPSSLGWAPHGALSQSAPLGRMLIDGKTHLWKCESVGDHHPKKEWKCIDVKNISYVYNIHIYIYTYCIYYIHICTNKIIIYTYIHTYIYICLRPLDSFRSANKYQTKQHKSNDPIDLLQTLPHGCLKQLNQRTSLVPEEPSVALHPKHGFPACSPNLELQLLKMHERGRILLEVSCQILPLWKEGQNHVRRKRWGWVELKDRKPNIPGPDKFAPSSFLDYISMSWWLNPSDDQAGWLGRLGIEIQAASRPSAKASFPFSSPSPGSRVSKKVQGWFWNWPEK